jgi:hypothetical protein
MIGSSNALFTSQRQKSLLREYASLHKQRSHEAPAILVQLSRIALETVVQLFGFDYHTVVMIPLLQHMSNVYDIPVHDYKDFPTSFPLGNPPLQNVQAFNPTEKKKKLRTMTNVPKRPFNRYRKLLFNVASVKKLNV